MTRPFYAIQFKGEEFFFKNLVSNVIEFNPQWQILDFHSAWYRDYLVHYIGILVGVKRNL